MEAEAAAWHIPSSSSFSSTSFPTQSPFSSYLFTPSTSSSSSSSSSSSNPSPNPTSYSSSRSSTPPLPSSFSSSKKTPSNPRIKKSNFINPKLKPALFFSARVHPGETPASWMMEGMLDFLTGDSIQASQLRHHYVIYIVPILNPDGVVFGNNRCSLAGN